VSRFDSSMGRKRRKWEGGNVGRQWEVFRNFKISYPNTYSTYITLNHLKSLSFQAVDLQKITKFFHSLFHLRETAKSVEFIGLARDI